MKGVGWLSAGLFIILFLLSIAIIKVGWGWIVPDIFAGAVEAGIMVSDLTWSQAAKLTLVLKVIGTAFTRSSGD